MKDTLQKFLVDNAPVRGELVEISDTWRQVQARRDYPVAVRTLLGEMLAASALLSANLKFNGMIVMQIHGDGPVKLLVVECDSELQLRATAKLSDDAEIADDATLTDLVNANGNGRFVITLDPKDKLPGQQAYQGVVPLDGESVATVIENYMLRSEQLDTKLWLAADEKVSRGLLLQKLPSIGGNAAPTVKPEGELEDWNHMVMLGDTLKREELLSTDIATLMHRLFWEQTIRVFDPVHPQFHCSCSREKVGNMLKMLGQEEVAEALSQMEKLAIDCDFCGQHYEFDAVDCAQLFVADVGGASEASDARH
ncbi:Hsp33 family molecular chaperone HslO [Herbaspirillum huttiense]|uniref:Hsp33 family molecular chaperone HslO n=2 Tax=Herbaspirillum huttiense TaxID=863372 RepID=A0AAJ2HFK1_9BURK|nr:Hsp33 family molecular chaperone HslO [Herbaspirillum huttiense]MDR9838738.1 Hsp33 family molecular chaperone HslO [Herbaspirillum huttiense]QBP75102.1 Hsp33 family molecular chaperone HslO [Herbaspirillum huttiense]